MTEKRSLYNSEAEMSVLGSAILKPAACEVVLKSLKPRHFRFPAHKVIFQVMLGMYAAGKAIDLVTLKYELGPSLEAIGGEDYLIQVAEAVPSAANAEYYAQVVRELGEIHWERERAEQVLKWTEDPNRSLAEIRSRAQLEPEDGPSGSIMGKVYKSAELLALTRTVRGIPTGFSAIDDEMSSGGWPIAQVSVVEANTGGGKSALLLSSAIQAAKSGRKVLYVVFADLSAEALGERLRKSLTGWSVRPDRPDLADLFDEDAGALTRNGGELDVFDHSKFQGRVNVESFRDWFDYHGRREGYDILFADYAQRIESERTTNQYEKLCIVSSELAVLAKRHEIPAVVGSQVTVVEGVTRTKGGRDLEEDAGLVVTAILNREEHPDQMKVRIKKNRFGASGIDAMLGWDGVRMRVYER